MARQEVGTEAMETYRHLSKKIAVGTGPGDLWDVLDDPEPQLRALHHYATVTSDILSRMSAALATGSGPDGVDADALIQEFRGLADLLEKASQGA